LFFTDIQYLKSVLPAYTEEEFFVYLRNLSAKDITLYAMEEGMVVFPKEPLIVIEGPLPIVQLMETPLLNLINYARQIIFFDNH
jgi:nicotinate phosphoribosyltransferase